ncbi:MAG: hypothetical protein ACU0DW_14535, partial [Shimia sp.]
MTRMISSSLLALLTALPALAQEQTALTSGFEPNNAILETSVPFTTGAREAKQSLRGSFGWQTFQEGLVNGIHYRFDPDGYARFSPSPRLDEDVFEVLCMTGSTVCIARKDELSLSIRDGGQAYLEIEGASTGDLFSLDDGASELPLPPEVMGVLDHRLEPLLEQGDELVLRRGDEVYARISLKGFEPVVAYLRWVDAGQDPRALPLDWPLDAAARGTPQTAADWTRSAQNESLAARREQRQWSVTTSGHTLPRMAYSSHGDDIDALLRQLAALEARLLNLSSPQSAS